MVNYKKAISPVVATALLLVVAVVAVVGFQSWFTSYQSKVNSDVERSSDIGSLITLERLDKNGIVYVKNGDISKDFNVTVSISDGTGCSENVSLVEASTVSKANCSCSLTKGEVYSVVAYSDAGVSSASLIAK